MHHRLIVLSFVAMTRSAAEMIAGEVWQVAWERRKPAGRINTCGRQSLSIRIFIELKMTTMVRLYNNA
jgi:hypothetical protein